jgi:hypothetical protein
MSRIHWDRFDLVVRQIVGKRLTYADVTGKTHDSATCLN